jgi:hypothetical protein
VTGGGVWLPGGRGVRALDAEDWPAVRRIYIEGIATLLHGKNIWW